MPKISELSRKYGISEYDLMRMQHGTFLGWIPQEKREKLERELIALKAGPHNIIENGGPQMSSRRYWIRSFNSAAEKQEYLNEKEAEKAKWRLYMKQNAESRAREAAERAEAARRLARTASARSASASSRLRRRGASASRSAAMTARHAANRVAETARREAEENAATARMNCLGRTCKRVRNYWSGTHTLMGTRKVKQNGGGRRK